MDSQWDAGRQIGPTAKDQKKKSHSVSRARLTSSSQDWSVSQDRRRGAREENSQRSNWTSQDIQSKKMSKRTIHGQSQKPRDIEENLNSEHLVKNNLHVSLHLYSAQSFKKLNFSQHVPFKNSSDLGLEEPTPRFSHSGPSDCLKLQKVRRTTPQSRHTQHPAQIPMLQRTVQYNEELYHMVQHDVIWIEIIQNKRKEKKKTHLWHKIYTHMRPWTCTKACCVDTLLLWWPTLLPAHGGETRSRLPPSEEQLYSFFSHSAPQRKQRNKAQEKAKLKIYTSPTDEII